jgi:hypothetical protein
MNKFWKLIKASVVKRFYIIYKINCECGMNYIGVAHNFKNKLRSHHRDIKHASNTQLCNHISQCDWVMKPISSVYGFKIDMMILKQHYIDLYDTIKHGLNTYRAYSPGEYKKNYQKQYRLDNNAVIIEKRRHRATNKTKLKAKKMLINNHKNFIEVSGVLDDILNSL